MVDIGNHHYAGYRAEMEVGQFVACGKSGYQQFLRIPARRIAAKDGIGGAWNRRFSVLSGDFVLPPVVAITACAGAKVTGPFDSDSVVV